MSCFWSHKWTKWEQYFEEGTIWRPWNKASEGIPYAEKRQKRKCLDCGKVEDEEYGR